MAAYRAKIIEATVTLYQKLSKICIRKTTYHKANARLIPATTVFASLVSLKGINLN